VADYLAAGTLAVGLRGAAALAAVLGLAVLLACGLRRAGLIRAPSRPGRLGVEGVVALDGRHRLMLVRCDGREHLLAVGPAGVSLLESRAAAVADSPGEVA
jgi:flagellar protein FliO/FliZ